MKNAEIIAVGSELLTPQKIDTNSLYLTQHWNALGVEVVLKTIVGDDRARLSEAIRGGVERSDFIVITGGLGPTEDDVTREAAATALNRTLIFRQDLFDEIANRFAAMKRKMAENNGRQAFLIDGAEALPNTRGTAPGQWISLGKQVVMLLPGPPKEMKAMWEAECLPRVTALLPPVIIEQRHYRVAGMGESDLDQLIAPVYTRYPNPTCTILAALGDIQVYLRARCTTANEAEALLREVGDQIENLLGDRIYSFHGEPLEFVVGELLRTRGETLAVAESATGGLLGSRLTSVAGSSAFFLGGVISYTDELKTSFLSVDRELLQANGAVCEPVASAMAEGIRKRAGSTYGVSVTGFAGPDGGTEEYPVGTVFIGIANPERTRVYRFFFLGDRDRVRTLSAQYALDLLRRTAARLPEPAPLART